MRIGYATQNSKDKEMKTDFAHNNARPLRHDVMQTGT
jgi:hypothetical protein